MFCFDPCMYMFRAYQSPSSMADCGPQCAQMPNLASRNHSGTSYLLSDVRVPSKGPRSISIPGDGSCCAAPSFKAGRVPAINLQAARLVILVDMVFHSPCATYSETLLKPRGKASPQSGLRPRRKVLLFSPAGVSVPCLLTYSFHLRLFSVTSVVKSYLGCGTARLY